MHHGMTSGGMPTQQQASGGYEGYGLYPALSEGANSGGGLGFGVGLDTALFNSLSFK